MENHHPQQLTIFHTMSIFKIHAMNTSITGFNGAMISSQAKFTVVDMGSGKIALHNAKYNRDLHSSLLWKSKP